VCDADDLSHWLTSYRDQRCDCTCTGERHRVWRWRRVSLVDKLPWSAQIISITQCSPWRHASAAGAVHGKFTFLFSEIRDAEGLRPFLDQQPLIGKSTWLCGVKLTCDQTGIGLIRTAQDSVKSWRWLCFLKGAQNVMIMDLSTQQTSPFETEHHNLLRCSRLWCWSLLT